MMNDSYSIMLVIIGGLMAVYPQTLKAQSTAEVLQQMQKQMIELQQRVTDLEEQNRMLRSQIPSPNTIPAASAGETQPSNQQSTSTESPPHGTRFQIPMVTSDHPIDIYGRLQFDAAYDDSRTNEGNFSRWVLPEDNNSGDDEFNTTAARTRIGVRLSGPEIGTAITSGLIEGDFFGGGDDNKSRFRLRHGFAQVHFPEYDLSFLAGQTYDIISPLFTPTVNFTTGFWVGNLGFRRAQFRVTKNWAVEEDSKITLMGGFSRTMGDLFGFDPGDTGEDAGFPTMQARLGYATPLLNDRPATIGLSGHWGQEEYDIDVFGNHHDFDSWSTNLDVTLPIIDKFKLTSEVWMGENLDSYVGGINQGVNVFTMNEIRAWGGWAAFTMGPWHQLTYNIGATLDNPDDDDLNAGGITQNASYFVNSLWQLNEALQLGFEVSYWETNYLDQTGGDNIRFQTSVKYKF